MRDGKALSRSVTLYATDHDHQWEAGLEGDDIGTRS